MKVLGIEAETDSGAAIVENGHILAAVNEERLSRMKLVKGFPRASINEVLPLANLAAADLDAVLVASTNNLLVDQLEPFDGWFQRSSKGFGSQIKRSAAGLSRYRKFFPPLEYGYYALLTPSFRKRRQLIVEILRQEFGVIAPIKFVDHHFAHITSAYFTSGFEESLVVSLDGGGDGKSARVCAVRRGRFEELHEVSAFNSLGNYYAYVTHICGFKAMKHEGKITGLAAHGQPIYLPLLRELIDGQGGSFYNRGGLVFDAAVVELRRRLPGGWTREDLAASIQTHFEELVPEFIAYWAKRTGLRNVAVAGGVFANVRVNEEVLHRPEIDRMFIHPGMADGGLAVGAALAAAAPGILEETMRRSPEPIEHVYLGPDLTVSEIESALEEAGLTPERISAPIEQEIGRLLAEGHIVARAEGRMEYGPRALGNRSILYQPTDASANDWLNDNLKRTEFMPFAPSTLYDQRDRCYQNSEGAEHTAQYMTITFQSTPWMRERMGGVVHVDGTARPHLVRKEVNPSYYRIIEAYESYTGLPTILNTSFNMHEEPIVCTARDAVRSFLSGKLDYLALGPYLIRNPAGLAHIEGRVMEGVFSQA